MQQYFVKGKAGNPVIITDKDTIKHMFQVMRLVEDDEVVLVFEDGIKRLAKVSSASDYQFDIVEELADNVEIRAATVQNGILAIALEQVVPEENKPKKIQITFTK